MDGKGSRQDSLSLWGMLPYLSDGRISEKIYIHECLESTNQTAKEMCLAGAGHGTVIIADRQTAGKGRYGRSFHSPPNHGLYMSVVLESARFHLSTPTLITAYAAVAVCEAIETISRKPPRIKWVNDIYIDGKKVCGILTETVLGAAGGDPRWLVAGIGVNFSTPAEAFPEELQQIAGSIFPAGYPTATRNRLAAEIINRMLIPGNLYDEKAMLEKYRRRMFILGETVSIRGLGETFEAVALDIDDLGRLLVKIKSGELLPLSSGEVSVLPARDP